MWYNIVEVFMIDYLDWLKFELDDKDMVDIRNHISSILELSGSEASAYNIAALLLDCAALDRKTIDSLTFEEAKQATINKSFNSLSDKAFLKIKNLIKTVDKEQLNRAAYCLSVDGESTPISIIRLAISLLNIDFGDSVADLCCGGGYFLTEAYKQESTIKPYGCDNNSKSVELAKARCRAIRIPEECIEQADILNALEVEDEEFLIKFDKIFSNYFMGLGLKTLTNEQEKYIQDLRKKYKFSNLDWIYNKAICKHLNYGGKAVAILSAGSINNKRDKSIRMEFLKNGLIETVIALPERMFPYYKGLSYLVVFSHNNRKVKMVDASSIYTPDRRINTFTIDNLKEITSLVNKAEGVEVSEILTSEYTSLDPKEYLNDDFVNKNYLPFSDYIECIIKGRILSAADMDNLVVNNFDGDEEYKLITPNDIQDSVLFDSNLYIDPKKMNIDMDKLEIRNGDIIITKGYPFKYTVADNLYYNHLYPSGNIYVIRLKENSISPYYILAFFDSKLGQKELERAKVGSVVGILSSERLKSVRIPVLPEAEVDSIAKHYSYSIKNIKHMKREIEHEIKKKCDFIEHYFK